MGAGSITAGTRFEAARAVADAMLYEGYPLDPCRRSSGRDRLRRQFGVLVPPAWAAARGLTGARAAGSAEAPWQQTECLLTASRDAIVHLRLRFLHLRRRSVEGLAADGVFRPAGSLETAWGTELSFDEAEPREYDLPATVGELLDGPVRLRVTAPGGDELSPLPDPGGRLAGRLRRRLAPIEARIRASAEVCPGATSGRGPGPAGRDGRRGEQREGAGLPEPGLVRLRVLVENVCENLPVSAPRERALAVSPLATHLLAAVDRGSFVSLLDPPEWAEAEARACANVRTYPVLAGQAGTRDLLLSSPILLPDHPQATTESPGDRHDATEIGEILSLRR